MTSEDFLLPCPIKKTFGVDCLGCGFQRALLILFKGNFAEAWQLYPPVFSVSIFLIFLFLSLADKKRNYSKLLKILLVFNLIFIPLSYFFKHF